MQSKRIFNEPATISRPEPAPATWVTDYEAITERLQSATRGRYHIFGRSYGGHPLWAITYGDPLPPVHKANYSSACGAGDLTHYIKRADRKPHILLLAATHGMELEGTAAVMGLIELLEGKKDWDGFRNEDSRALSQMLDHITLTIIPIHNPDGRLRHKDYHSTVGLTFDEVRYLMQGTWSDGTLCGWPGVKTEHPLKPERVAHLGAYFNDGGINPIHDSFPLMKSPENEALFGLVDIERPDYIASLHGGTNSINHLTMSSYSAHYALQHIAKISAETARRSEAAGLQFTDTYGRRNLGLLEKDRVPSFNQISALHNFSGAVAFIHESNQGLDYPGTTRFSYEEILTSYGVFFHVLLDHAQAHSGKELHTEE